MYIPGTILMWTALLAGIASTITYWLSIREPERWRGPARQSYVLMTFAIVVGSALLMYLLVTHDYRLHYVWAYSDNLLPLHYLISTFWGGQEGSFMLWIFWGVLLGLPLMRFARSYEPRVMVVYNLTLLSLILLLVKQDPFRFHQGLTAAMTPMDGQGLNPLLQNPWMVIHPPIMFIGYASLGIPFAFAIAALWMQRYDEWTKVSMPWVLLSLGSLGTAIMLGGYWAYETLGWGGYWGWDPVEIAAFMPWLAGTAFLHSVMIQEHKGMLKHWNMILIILTYALVIFGTFLTRSGVLSSVHAFAQSAIGPMFFAFIGTTFITSVALLIWRWPDLQSETEMKSMLSREAFFLLNNLLFLSVLVVCFWGVIFPLVSELFTGQKVTVGPPFYERANAPIFGAMMALMGIAPLSAWGKSTLLTLGRAIWKPTHPLPLFVPVIAYFDRIHKLDCPDWFLPGGLRHFSHAL